MLWDKQNVVKIIYRNKATIENQQREEMYPDSNPWTGRLLVVFIQLIYLSNAESSMGSKSDAENQASKQPSKQTRFNKSH